MALPRLKKGNRIKVRYPDGRTCKRVVTAVYTAGFWSHPFPTGHNGWIGAKTPLKIKVL